jgi:outer membrane protein OmpA-like peptidoglycan-associated protein
MKLNKITLVSFFAALSPALSFANVCGTDYQNFNPLTSGLDFITVHSSETLQPCYMNLGVFINYSRDTLTYTRDVGTGRVGDKANDSMWSSDLNVGMGITNNWDAGISFPAVLKTSVQDAAFASYLEDTGLTEIRLNTKYRFRGDEHGGLAAVATLNLNTIQNNPYTGSNPGPTLGLDFVADTTLNQDWAVGGNIGYRKRNPGAAIAGVPIFPVTDQFTYSAAINRYIKSWDSKLVFEIFGAKPVSPTAGSTERSQSSLETLVGMKTDLKKELSVHYGLGTALQTGTASPAWRAYAGLNWSFGPFCDQTTPVQKNDDKITTYTFKAEILFDFNSDVLHNEGKVALDNLAVKLKEAGYDKITVEGHTDSIGKAAYNLDLSQRRAKTVRDYLLKKHNVEPKKLSSVGYGETRPIADNSNAQGRRANRRVEFVVERK